MDHWHRRIHAWEGHRQQRLHHDDTKRCPPLSIPCLWGNNSIHDEKSIQHCVFFLSDWHSACTIVLQQSKDSVEYINRSMVNKKTENNNFADPTHMPESKPIWPVTIMALLNGSTFTISL
jgi:hypothetical protein